MEWSEIGAFVRRRRLLLLISLLATLAAGATMITRVPPEYSAQGEVLLLPPGTVVGDSGNPFLSLDGLTPIGDVVATSLSSKSRMLALESQGATAEYVVARDAESPAPMLLVDVTGRSVDETMKTLGLVMGSLGPALEQVQRDVSVPPRAYVKSLEVTRSETPERSLKAPIRAFIVGAGGVGALLLGLVVVYDAVRRPRRPSPVENQASGGGDPPVLSEQERPSSRVERRMMSRSGAVQEQGKSQLVTVHHVELDDDGQPVSRAGRVGRASSKRKARTTRWAR